MPSPSLIIRRIVVEGNFSCDISLDEGLNIIQAVSADGDTRSTNKAGKTSLIELIQHGLGRRHKSKAKFYFAPILRQLKTLWLEIEVNGTVLTIERSMQDIFSSIKIRESLYSASIKNTTAEIVAVEDMSDLLLNSLNIPKVVVKTFKGDTDTLTFPNLMRAFILHQDDSFSEILDRVEPNSKRTEIIGFLTRIIPTERFSGEDERARVQQEITILESQYNAIYDFLIGQGVPSLERAKGLVSTAEEELQIAKTAQIVVQEGIQSATNNIPSIQTGRISYLRSQLLGLKEEIAQLERSLLGLNQEEKRLTELLASLENDRKKRQRLQASTIILSSIEFGICPRCLLEITPEMRQREQYARCSLCNRPLRTTSDTLPRSIPKNSDIDLQIQEVTEILTDVKRENHALSRRLAELVSTENEIGRTLNEESRVYISPAIDQLLACTVEVNHKEATLAVAKNLLNYANELDLLRLQLDKSKQHQAELEDQFREANTRSQRRLNTLREIYGNILQSVEFPGFRNCIIDTQSLMPSINGNLYTHSGSALRGLAVACYHLALLELSRETETFFPRMLILDSPSVGDLNEENYDKLLEYLAGLQNINSLDQNSHWQVILTTRKVVPNLQGLIKEVIRSPDRMLLRQRS